MAIRITKPPVRTIIFKDSLQTKLNRSFYKALDGSEIDASLPNAAEELAQRNRAYRERTYRPTETKKY